MAESHETDSNNQTPSKKTHSRKAKNKYLVFVGIGFELIGMILVALYLGKYLTQSLAWNRNTPALLVVLAFVFWFISLFTKLKQMNK